MLIISNILLELANRKGECFYNSFTIGYLDFKLQKGNRNEANTETTEDSTSTHYLR